MMQQEPRIKDDLTSAEREAVDRFCQTLGLALRRLMGQPPVKPPTDLPKPIENVLNTPQATSSYGAVP